jgi:hypothetical protein
MLFLDEILTTPRFRFCFTCIDGLFDGSDMTTTETGDLRVQSHVCWTRKLMVAALRAFAYSSGEKSGHLNKSHLSRGQVHIKARHSAQGKPTIASAAPWCGRLA